MAEDKKRIDWFVNAAKGNISSTEQLHQDNVDPVLKSKDYYKSKDFVREMDMFKDANGDFSDSKYDEFYDQQLAAHNKFHKEDFALNSLYDLDYDDTLNRVSGIGQIRTPTYVKPRKDNPYMQKESVFGLGKREDREYTAMEVAEMQGYYKDNAKGENVKVGGQVNAWNVPLFETLSLATDENGAPALDENGKFYLETLEGKDPSGRQIFSRLNGLTDEGSFWNDYDFMDNDGMNKSTIGVVANMAAQIAPAFIPYVGPAYVYTRIGKSILDAGSEGLKAIDALGEKAGIDLLDQSSLNRIQSFTRQFNSTMSEHAMENPFSSIEGWGNLVTDVVLQLKEQTALGLMPGQLKSLMNPKKIQSFATKNNMKFQDVLKDGSLMSEALGKEAFDKAAASGSKIATAYMAATSAQGIVDVAKAAKLDAADAGALYLGLTAAFVPLFKANIGSWALASVGIKENKAIMDNVIKNYVDDMMNVAQMTEPAAKKAANLTLGKRIGTEIAEQYRKILDKASKGGLSDYSSAATAEALEEMSEVGLQESLKTIYNGLSAMGYTSTKGKSFEVFGKDFLYELGASAAGGAVGGAIFKRMQGIPNYDEYDLNQMIQAGKTRELLSSVESLRRSSKGIASKNLSTETYMKDGKLLYKAYNGEEGDVSHNDFVADMVKQEIVKNATIMRQRGLDSSALDKIVRNHKEVMADFLGGEYDSVIKKDIEELTTKMVPLAKRIGQLDKQINNLEDGEEKNALIQEKAEEQAQLDVYNKDLQSIKETRKSEDYLNFTLFNLNPDVSIPFLESELKNADSIANEMYNLDYKDIQNEEHRKNVDEELFRYKLGLYRVKKNAFNKYKEFYNDEAERNFKRLREPIVEGSENSIILEAKRNLDFNAELNSIRKELDVAINELNSTDATKYGTYESESEEAENGLKHLNEITKRYTDSTSKLEKLLQRLNDFTVDKSTLDDIFEYVETVERVFDTKNMELIESFGPVFISDDSVSAQSEAMEGIKENLQSASTRKNLPIANYIAENASVIADIENYASRMSEDELLKSSLGIESGELYKKLLKLREAYNIANRKGSVTKQEAIDIMGLDSGNITDNFNESLDAFIKNINDSQKQYINPVAEVKKIFNDIEERIANQETLAEDTSTPYASRSNEIALELLLKELGLFGGSVVGISEARGVNPIMNEFREKNKNIVSSTDPLMVYSPNEEIVLTSIIKNYRDRVAALQKELREQKDSLTADIKSKGQKMFLTFRDLYNSILKSKDKALIELSEESYPTLYAIQASLKEGKEQVLEKEKLRQAYAEMASIETKFKSLLSDVEIEEVIEDLSKDLTDIKQVEITTERGKLPELSPTVKYYHMLAVFNSDVNEFYGSMHKHVSAEGNFAPVFEQELALRHAYAYVVNDKFKDVLAGRIDDYLNVLNISGIPGSGKTFFMQKLLSLITESSVGVYAPGQKQIKNSKKSLEGLENVNVEGTFSSLYKALGIPEDLTLSFATEGGDIVLSEANKKSLEDLPNITTDVFKDKDLLMLDEVSNINTVKALAISKQIDKYNKKFRKGREPLKVIFFGDEEQLGETIVYDGHEYSADSYLADSRKTPKLVQAVRSTRKQINEAISNARTMYTRVNKKITETMSPDVSSSEMTINTEYSFTDADGSDDFIGAYAGENNDKIIAQIKKELQKGEAASVLVVGDVSQAVSIFGEEVAPFTLTSKQVQGSEADYVIILEKSPKYEKGFMNVFKAKWLNTMVSRAKKGIAFFNTDLDGVYVNATEVDSAIRESLFDSSDFLDTFKEERVHAYEQFKETTRRKSAKQTTDSEDPDAEGAEEDYERELDVEEEWENESLMKDNLPFGGDTETEVNIMTDGIFADDKKILDNIFGAYEAEPGTVEEEEKYKDMLDKSFMAKVAVYAKIYGNNLHRGTNFKELYDNLTTSQKKAIEAYIGGSSEIKGTFKAIVTKSKAANFKNKSTRNYAIYKLVFVPDSATEDVPYITMFTLYDPGAKTTAYDNWSSDKKEAYDNLRKEFESLRKARSMSVDDFKRVFTLNKGFYRKIRNKQHNPDMDFEAFRRIPHPYTHSPVFVPTNNLSKTKDIPQAHLGIPTMLISKTGKPMNTIQQVEEAYDDYLTNYRGKDRDNNPYLFLTFKTKRTGISQLLSDYNAMMTEFDEYSEGGAVDNTKRKEFLKRKMHALLSNPSRFEILKLMVELDDLFKKEKYAGKIPGSERVIRYYQGKDGSLKKQIITLKYTDLIYTAKIVGSMGFKATPDGKSAVQNFKDAVRKADAENKGSDFVKGKLTENPFNLLSFLNFLERMERNLTTIPEFVEDFETLVAQEDPTEMREGLNSIDLRRGVTFDTSEDTDNFIAFVSKGLELNPYPVLEDDYAFEFLGGRLNIKNLRSIMAGEEPEVEITDTEGETETPETPSQDASEESSIVDDAAAEFLSDQEEEESQEKDTGGSKLNPQDLGDFNNNEDC